MLELLKNHRSIRKFKDRAVEADKIEKVIQGVLLSPSSRDAKPWEFIVVTDKEILKKLSSSQDSGSQFIKDAPLAIVVLADPELSNVWIEDAAIAAILMQLVAESLELGSCWSQVRDTQHSDQVSSEAYVRQTLNIPENLKVEAIIAIGYPDETKEDQQIGDLEYNKVLLNDYKTKYDFKK